MIEDALHEKNSQTDPQSLLPGEIVSNLMGLSI